MLSSGISEPILMIQRSIVAEVVLVSIGAVLGSCGSLTNRPIERAETSNVNAQVRSVPNIEVKAVISRRRSVLWIRFPS